MGGSGLLTRLPALTRPSINTIAWICAVISYVIGDTATTVYFLSTTPATEANPLVETLIGSYGLWAIVGWKLLLFGPFYLVYRLSPAWARITVPIVVALLGVVLTGWNLYHGLVVLQCCA
ncbi:DUF5658 family protein [Natrinema saccharevitans]|uniref:DUF5658 family protein n=1 Tax=Natrinema saccharevitans TaxID=301967 RepID=UPI0011154A2B|nr:DUF5658 family protein [Natrinema saccharevitans]